MTRRHTKTQTRTLQGPVGKESLDSRVRKLMSSPTGLIMSTRERLALVLIFGWLYVFASRAIVGSRLLTDAFVWSDRLRSGYVRVRKCVTML